MAAPIPYNINFIADVGTPPTSGSFMYDSVAEEFSAFIVVWEGQTFDLTASANLPFVTGSCDTPNTNPADLFAILAGLCGTGGPAWRAPDLNFSAFSIGSGFPPDSGDASVRAFSQRVEPSFGSYSLTPVPEPTSVSLMLAGGVLLALRQRRSPGA